MYNPTDYAYIVGRLRALNTRLLSVNLVERMIDADSAADAFRILNDLTFLSGCIGDSTVKDFQSVLSGGTQKMLNLINRMSPNPETSRFLNLKFDFYNLKVALKARLTQRGYADIKQDDLPVISDSMKNILDVVYSAYESNSDPQIVDLIVDNHFLEESLALAKKLNSQLTISYIKRLIDFTNLKTLIRCKELKKSVEYLDSVLLSGGNISEEVFSGNHSKNYDEIRASVESKLHSDDLVTAMDEFISEGTLIILEKRMSELLERFMKQADRMSFGPEPVFAFFRRFENHIQILRSILVGKLNQLSAEEIRKHTLIL